MTSPTNEHREQAREIVEQTYLEGCDWHGPIVTAHCYDLHRERLEGRIASALSSRDAEIREVLEGLITHVFDEGDGPQLHWCSADEDGYYIECGPSCERARSLWSKLQPKESSDVTE